MSKTIVQFADIDGSTENMKTSYDNGEITFVTDHLSEYMVVLNDNSFNLVNPIFIIIAGIIGIVIILVVILILRRRSGP